MSNLSSFRGPWEVLNAERMFLLVAVGLRSDQKRDAWPKVGLHYSSDFERCCFLGVGVAVCGLGHVVMRRMVMSTVEGAVKMQALLQFLLVLQRTPPVLQVVLVVARPQYQP